MAAGMALEAVKEAASKAGENANRIAGIFAVIEGTKQINKDQMTRAWKLVIYDLEGSVRGAKLKAASDKERDAVGMLEWIRGQPVRQITINEIQRKVIPKTLRKRVGVIRLIMAALTKEGKVKPVSTNSKGDADAWELT